VRGGHAAVVHAQYSAKGELGQQRCQQKGGEVAHGFWCLKCKAQRAVHTAHHGKRRNGSRFPGGCPQPASGTGNILLRSSGTETRQVRHAFPRTGYLSAMAGLPIAIERSLREAGSIAHFAGRFFRNAFHPRFAWDELLRQCVVNGYRSLALVGITAFIMGLVLTVQSRPTLARFGAESMLPAMVAVSMVREIVPVITALICAGKIGSSMGAELGSMRVTEQIDAMEVSGTNPFRYLVVTRVWSTILTLPILVVLADVIAIGASWVG